MILSSLRNITQRNDMQKIIYVENFNKAMEMGFPHLAVFYRGLDETTMR